VTVSAYHASGSRVLVPQRIEPARRARALSGAQISQRRQAGGSLRPAIDRSQFIFSELIAIPPLCRAIEAISHMSKGASSVTRRTLTSVAGPGPRYSAAGLV
jgi:hypothetical protein